MGTPVAVTATSVPRSNLKTRNSAGFAACLIWRLKAYQVGPFSHMGLGSNHGFNLLSQKVCLSLSEGTSGLYGSYYQSMFERPDSCSLHLSSHVLYTQNRLAQNPYTHPPKFCRHLTYTDQNEVSILPPGSPSISLSYSGKFLVKTQVRLFFLYEVLD